MSSEDSLPDEAVNRAPERGSISSSGRNWKCPFCDHSLTYEAKNRDVAELAAHSHINRQHKQKKMILVLPDADPGRADPVGESFPLP